MTEFLTSAWPWWSGPVIALVLIAGTWRLASISVQRRNLQIKSMARGLAQAGLGSDDSAFAVMGDKNGIVVGGIKFAVVDLRGGRVVQVGNIGDILALKAYEDKSDSIQFRLVSKSGSQSRKVKTQSIVDFVKLFDLLASTGKRIEYIQD